MWREGLRPPDPFARRRPAVERLQTQDGMSLATLSGYGPLRVSCLPALGTAACRRTLADIARGKPAIEAAGKRLVLVHMAATDDHAHAALEPFGLQYCARIADPDGELYDHFGLGHETGMRRLGRRLATLRPGHPPTHGDPLRQGGTFDLPVHP